jgi:enoyl-CoA hydratase
VSPEGDAVLLRERHDSVEVLTMNRPASANALDPQLLSDLNQAVEDIDQDDGVRVVVLTGAGERHFCAGMDLAAFSAGPDESGEGNDSATGDSGGRSPLDLFQRPGAKPIIAAVNGVAVGGGFELVLACDMVVAVEGARFGMPEVRRGLIAGGGGTLLGTRVPLALALEVGLTGEFVDVERAAQWGLVNQVVPRRELMDSALQLAGVVAANGPLAVRTTKKLMRRAVTEHPISGWGSSEEIAAVFQSEDAREGAMAFLEKRAPVWKGR